jgi:zinc protease
MARTAVGVNRTVLENGVRVLSSCSDAAPTFSLALSLEAGSRYDGAETSGLASLLAGILLEGTESSSGTEFAERIDSAGAVFDVASGYETCVASLTGLAERFSEAVDALGEATRRPRFAQPEFERAKRKQLAEIAEEDDDPFMLLRREFFGLVYGEHPRSRPVNGRPETVGRVSLDDVRAFHRARFSPATSVLAVSGAVPVREAIDAAAGVFGGWRGSEVADSQGPPPARVSGRRFVRMERNQTHIIVGGLGVARADDAYHPLSVMDVILGDSAGFGCRLGRRLRECDGLAYLVESDTVNTAGIDPGVFWVYTATSPSQADRALEAVLEELHRFCSEPLTQREVETAVAYMLGRHRMDGETNEARAGRLVGMERYGLGLDYDLRYDEIMHAVTPGDVAAAARRVLDPDHLSVVAVGPSPVDGCE